jgi:hypothetical protein
MLIPIEIATGKKITKKKKVTSVSPEEQAKAFDILRKQTAKESEFEAKRQKEAEANIRKRTVVGDTMVYGSPEEGAMESFEALTRVSRAEAGRVPGVQTKVAPTVKATPEGNVVKKIATKYGVVTYTATPDESNIFRSGDVDAIQQLTKNIVDDAESIAKEQGRKVKINTGDKYIFDTVNAALDERSIDTMTTNALKTIFKAIMPPMGQKTSDILASSGEALTTKGKELFQSESNLAKGAGIASSLVGGILEEASNPAAFFTAKTMNVLDPTATTEERVGAGGNIALYALSALPAIGAAGAGRAVLKSGGTATEALTAATRSLLRDVVPAGKYIDNRITLKGVLNVIEADGQLGNLTRSQLAKQLSQAAKNSGQDAGAFYTRYLNKYTEGKGLLTSPAYKASFEPASPTAPAIPEPPVSAIPEPAVPTPVLSATDEFDWSNPALVEQLRQDLKTQLASKLPDAGEDQLSKVADQLLERKKGQKNPYIATDNAGVDIDWRTNEPVNPTPTAPVVEPPVSAIPEPPVVETPTATIPEPVVEPTVAPTVEPPTSTIPDLQPSPEVTTALKNASMQDDLREMGFDDLPDTKKETFQGFLDEAVAKGLDKESAINTILDDFALGKKRALSPEETMGMAKYAAFLKNERRRLQNLFDATKDGDIARQIQVVQQKFRDVSQVAKEAGAEAAKALVARKGLLDDDYSLATILNDAAVARMAGLNKEQILAEAQKIAKRTGESVEDIIANGLHSKKEIDDLTAKVNELEQANVTAKEAYDKLKAELDGGLLAEQRAAKKSARTKENARARAEQAKSDFLALTSPDPNVQAKSANLDPRFLKPLAQYIKAKIDEGVIILKESGNLDEIVAKLQSDGINVDTEDVADALQFDRQTRPKLSDLQKEKQRLQRQLMAEARQVSPGASDAERLAKSKQRLQDKIDSLDEQIRTGNYLEKVPRKVRQMDDELYALQLKAKLKQRQVDNELRRLAPKTTVARVNEILLSNQLASIYSRAQDIISGLVMVPSKLMEMPSYSFVNPITAKILGEDRLSGSFVTRANDILKRAALRTGYEWKGSFDKLGGNTFGGKMKSFVSELGGVAAEAGDVPYKSLYYVIGEEVAAEDKAIKLLKKQGKYTKDDVDLMRESILRDIENHPDVTLAAEDFSLRNTFNNDNLISRVSSGVKRTTLSSLGLKKGTNVGDAVDSLLDVLFFRFGKVIGNVAATTSDYIPGVGIARGAANLGVAKYKKLQGQMISVAERDAINQMFARGLTGIATYTLYKAIMPKIFNANIVGEKGQERLDFGDSQKLGGLTVPMLIAAADDTLDKYKDENGEPFTPEKKRLIRNQFLFDLALSNPMASNTKDILDALMGDGDPQVKLMKIAIKKGTTTLIPGQFRDWARRQETESKTGLLTGKEPQRVKFKRYDPTEEKVKTSNDWRVILTDELRSKLPKTVLNPEFNRQSLPIKGTEEEVLTPPMPPLPL